MAVEALDYCFGCFGLPAAAWAAEAPNEELSFVGTVGFDPQSGEESLAIRLSRVRPWRWLSSAERSALLEGFATTAGHREADAIDAENILVLVAGASPAVSGRLGEIRRFLIETTQPIEDPPASTPDAIVDAVAVAAHEIRAPLVAARAAVERALLEPQSPDARTLLTRSVRELDQLSRDVGQVLRWASDVEAILPSPTRVRDIVLEACASASRGWDASRIVVRDLDGLFVMVDAASMSSAIANLIRNALAYTPTDARIEIRAEPGRGSVAITVSDSGPGIPVAEQGILFRPFVRGRSGAAGLPGAGLGLYIAWKVVQAHGGRIFVRSTGRGSIFTIELPVAGSGS